MRIILALSIKPEAQSQALAHQMSTKTEGQKKIRTIIREFCSFIHYGLISFSMKNLCKWHQPINFD
jgi:hypothetical protein